MFPKDLRDKIISVHGESLGVRWIFAGNLMLGGISPKEAVEKGRIHDVWTLVNIAHEVKMRERASREYIDVRVIEQEVLQLVEKND